MLGLSLPAGARAPFAGHLEWKDIRNAQQRADAQFTATLQRQGGSWVFTELR